MLITYTKRSLLLITFIVFAFHVQAQINVNDNVTAAQLVQKLVGTGISYANPVLICDSFGAGEFTVINSNLGLGSGIVLTSGYAKTDPNDPTHIGVDGDQATYFAANCVPGPPESGWTDNDPDLDSIIDPTPTFNRCVLEFDFIPDGDSLLFNYVFGSEEYDSYSCSAFNDAFAFLLSGPGITGKPNIALVPGTNIPVSINSTTNPAVTNPGSLGPCQAMGPGSPFAQYYVDNSVGTSITYYGFTTVLTARAAVLPCTTYHIKLVVADGTDCTLDSGVFLEENSFRSTNIKLKLESSLGMGYDYLVEGCTQGIVTVKRNTPFPISQTVKLSYSGDATKLIDYTSVPDSLVIPANDTMASFSFDILQDNVFEGFEYITVNIINICTGNVIDSVTFKIYDYLPYTFLGNDTTVCATQGVRLEVDGDQNFDWLWRGVPSGQIDNPNQIKTFAHPDTTTTYYVSATYKGCVTDTSGMTAIVEPYPTVDISPNDTAFCLHDPYLIVADIGPKWYNGFSYTWMPTDFLDNPAIPSPYFYNLNPGEYKYVLTVSSPIGCIGKDSVTILTRPAPELFNVTEDFTLRYGETKQLHAEGATYFTWTPTRLLDYPTEYNPTATGIDTATFQVIGTDQYGCRDTAYVRMNIDYTMFEMVPNAFSPNGDGRNDVFSIRNMKYQRLIEFRIFNRWGQEIFSTTDPKKGWDGTYDGVPQEVGVYQYLIRITAPGGGQRTYKGDVSLIR